MPKLKIAAALTAGLLAIVACAPKQEAAPAAEPSADAAPATAPLEARAILAPREGGTVAGEVHFTESDGEVRITAHITGAPPGTHGFHLHEAGDCSAADFTSAGGHFNPTGMPHGGPGDLEHHAGDLGNIEVGADGSAHVETSSTMLTVADGPNSVVGRGVILHEKADDFATQPTGAAGGRLACGVIERAGG